MSDIPSMVSPPWYKQITEGNGEKHSMLVFNLSFRNESAQDYSQDHIQHSNPFTTE